MAAPPQPAGRLEPGIGRARSLGRSALTAAAVPPTPSPFLPPQLMFSIARTSFRTQSRTFATSAAKMTATLPKLPYGYAVSQVSLGPAERAWKVVGPG